jgi:putative membrane protein
VAGNSEKILLIVVATVVAIIAASAFSFKTMGGYSCGSITGSSMIGAGMMGGSGMGFGWMLLWPVLLVIAIIVGIYFILTSSKQKEASPQVSVNSLEILKERYAKGEVTAEEFKKMKKNLTD